MGPILEGKTLGAKVCKVVLGQFTGSKPMWRKAVAVALAQKVSPAPNAMPKPKEPSGASVVIGVEVKSVVPSGDERTAALLPAREPTRICTGAYPRTSISSPQRTEVPPAPVGSPSYASVGASELSS